MADCGVGHCRRPGDQRDTTAQGWGGECRLSLSSTSPAQPIPTKMHTTSLRLRLAHAISRPTQLGSVRPAQLPRTRLPALRAYSTPASFLSTTLSPAPAFFNSVNPTATDGTPYPQIPAFRTLDGDGSVLPTLDPAWLAKLGAIPHETLTKMLDTMTLLPGLDTVLSSSQRQGRISFYMTSYGEEGGEPGSNGVSVCVRRRWVADSADRVWQLWWEVRRRGRRRMRCLDSTGRLGSCSTGITRKL